MKKRILVMGVLVMLILALTADATSAAFTYSISAQDATVTAKEKYTTETFGTPLPYDRTQYSLDLYAVHGENIFLEHSVDDAEGVEAETSLLYIPYSGVKQVYLDEGVNKARIAPVMDNASFCVSGEAGTSVSANLLQYESASVVTDTAAALAVKTVGMGTFKVDTSELRIDGLVNGTYNKAQSSSSIAVRGGLFNVSAEWVISIPDFPAGESPECHLCPFARP